MFIFRPDDATSSCIPREDEKKRRRTKQVASRMDPGGEVAKSNSILVASVRSAKIRYGSQKPLLMESLDVGCVFIQLLLPLLPGRLSLAVCQTASKPLAETATPAVGVNSRTSHTVNTRFFILLISSTHPFTGNARWGRLRCACLCARGVCLPCPTC